ncbi:MAG: hypothetical protein HWE22_14335 [Flavobacteriales bacterium]|nr:hypothetical protein [Flavobacteriales bacterium]
MRALLIMCVTALVVLGCAHPDSYSDSNDMHHKDGVIATVTTAYQSEGCDVLLEVEVEGEIQLLLPIELEEKFKKQGTKLKITFHPSRIMHSDCHKGIPIAIDNIKLIE